VGDAPTYDLNMIASAGSPQIECIGQSKSRRDGESGANSREIRHEALRRLAIRQEDARGQVRLLSDRAPTFYTAEADRLALAK
jgi:hypothetical protein